MTGTTTTAPRVFRLRGEIQGRQQTFVLADRESFLGAQTGVAVHLPVRRISRRHAVIRVAGNDAVIEDLQSTNGTFVNGIEVRKKRLAEGDWVQLGPVILTFESIPADEHDLAIPLRDGGNKFLLNSSKSVFYNRYPSRRRQRVAPQSARFPYLFQLFERFRMGTHYSRRNVFDFLVFDSNSNIIRTCDY